MAEHNPPVERIRTAGLEATVWENAADDGVYFTVTMQRSYRDAQSDEWKSTHVLRQKDVLTASELLRMAHERIVGRIASERNSARQAAAMQHGSKKR